MNQKRLHLLLGIGGIYLALLTIYLCLAAGVLLVSTLRSMIQMDMFDFQRWSLQNAMPLYIAMALSVLSGLAKLLSGVLGALCLFSPPTEKRLQRLGVALCAVQALEILCDWRWGRLSPQSVHYSTFAYLLRIALIWLIAWGWKHRDEAKEPERFPFLREFALCRGDGRNSD